MPSPPPPVLALIATHKSKNLPDADGLFEHGEIDRASDANSFVRRLNRHLFVTRMRTITITRPKTFKAITANGRLDRCAEMVVFGDWLFTGMPSRKRHRGPAPDPRRLLKVVAAALAALDARGRAKDSEDTAVDSLRPIQIAKIWNLCFDGSTKSSDHSSAVRSLRQILPDYMALLAAGRLSFDGLTVKTSPLMANLREALAPTAPSAPVMAASLSASSAPAVVPATFEIPLSYSSPEVEKEYRNLGSASPELPSLGYKIEPVSSTSCTGVLRPDREGRLVLRPEFDVRRMMKAKSLIDRIAFTVSTKAMTSYGALQKAIKTGSGATVFVSDRTLRAEDWWVCLPEVALLEPTGRHFAILLQEPTPDLLRRVLKAVENAAGIEGVVRPFLLELAVDFYPVGAADLVESVLMREQIVGLLQRHHWASSTRLLPSNPDAPRHIDPRQVYVRGTETKLRYLFADGKERCQSDSAFAEPSVRRRILNAKAGNDLYLNATIYRGSRLGPLRTNVQHKVADERNTKKGTLTPLPHEACRGRVEVTLTSLETHEAFGLNSIEELANLPFRTIIRNLLRFRLPTCAPNAEAVHDGIAQMTTRGVYGVEMKQRAANEALREQTRPKPRNSDREGWGLVDWPEMNDTVGVALDRLKGAWSRF